MNWPLDLTGQTDLRPTWDRLAQLLARPPEIARPEGENEERISGAAFSPDGKRTAFAFGNRTPGTGLPDAPVVARLSLRARPTNPFPLAAPNHYGISSGGPIRTGTDPDTPSTEE